MASRSESESQGQERAEAAPSGEAEALLSKVLEGLSPEISTVGSAVSVKVPPDCLKEAAQRLKAAGFDHVKAVTGIDRPDSGEIELVYHVSSYLDPRLSRWIVALRTTLPRDDPETPSLYDVWPSVKYHEMEQREMLGIRFSGHPDPRRLLLPESYEGIPPLRKDFKVKVEGINA